MSLPFSGLFTGIGIIFRTFLRDWRFLGAAFTGIIFHFFKNNSVRLVLFTVSTGIVYVVQGYLMSYFDELAPQLRECLTIASVPDALTIIIAAYIWRLTHFSSSWRITGWGK